MDHIPIPQNPFEYPVIVPALGVQRTDLAYDHLGIDEFAERKGFDPHKFALGEFGQWTSQEALTLFQSFAFFGLLHGTSQSVGLPIDLGEYIQDGNITTAPLPYFLRKWEHLERGLDDNARQLHRSKVDNYIRYISLMVYLVFDRWDESLKKQLPHLFHTEEPRTCACRNGHDFCENCPVSTAEVVLLSIAILIEYLWKACRLYGIPQEGYWFVESNYLKRRLLRAGYCRQEVARFHDITRSTSTIFYLSIIDRRSLGFRHFECTASRCSRQALDNATYKTKHSLDCSSEGTGNPLSCSKVDFDPWINRRISGLVIRGLTPVITVTSAPDTHKYNVTIQAVEKPVFSKCSTIIDRLRLQRKIYFHIGKATDSSSSELTPYVAISHVWADGMGNLKYNGLPSCQLLRIQSLVNALYPESSWPVPWWMDTICVPRRYPARTEAIKAMKEIYWFADKVLVLDAVLMQTDSSQAASATEIAMRLWSSTWATRLWTYHEAGLARTLYYQLQQDVVDADTIRNLRDKERLSNAVSKSRDYEAASLAENALTEEDISKRLEGLDLVFLNGITFAHEIESYSFIPDAEDYVRLSAITRPLRWRTTSRNKDEAICIAGLLNRRVDDLLPRELSAVQRMKRLLTSLESVPDGILFVKVPRLKEEGCRWVPETFLGCGSSASMPVVNNKAVPSAAGLHVELPGVIMRMRDFVPQFSDETSTFTVIQIESSLYSIWDASNTAIVWSDYASQEMAVVLQHRLGDDTHEKRLVLGALVTLKALADGTQTCRFEHLVEVTYKPLAFEIDSPDNWMAPEAKYFEMMKWCIG